MANQVIPDGYLKNAKGDLVNIKNIKPVDLLRDELVKRIIENSKPIASALKAFKENSFAEIQAFIEQSISEYGTSYKGKKGNVQLVSFDGRFKLEKAVQDRITFDERLLAAKELIDTCLTEWSQGANHNLTTVVKNAFQVDKAGNIRVASILSLRRYEIRDSRWQQAMQAIGDAIQVVESKSYIRLYERDDNGAYHQIPLDIASI